MQYKTLMLYLIFLNLIFLKSIVPRSRRSIGIKVAKILDYLFLQSRYLHTNPFIQIRSLSHTFGMQISSVLFSYYPTTHFQYVFHNTKEILLPLFIKSFHCLSKPIFFWCQFEIDTLNCPQRRSQKNIFRLSTGTGLLFGIKVSYVLTRKSNFLRNDFYLN